MYYFIEIAFDYKLLDPVVDFYVVKTISFRKCKYKDTMSRTSTRGDMVSICSRKHCFNIIRLLIWSMNVGTSIVTILYLEKCSSSRGYLNHQIIERWTMCIYYLETYTM